MRKQLSQFYKSFSPSQFYIESMTNKDFDTYTTSNLLQNSVDKRVYSNWILNSDEYTHIYGNVTYSRSFRTTNRAGKDDFENYHEGLILLRGGKREGKKNQKFICSKLQVNVDVLIAANNLLTFKSRYSTDLKIPCERVKRFDMSTLTVANLFREDSNEAQLKKIITYQMARLAYGVISAQITLRIDEYFFNEKTKWLIEADEDTYNSYFKGFHLFNLQYEDVANIFDCGSFTVYTYFEDDVYKILMVPNGTEIAIMYEAKRSDYLEFVTFDKNWRLQLCLSTKERYLGYRRNLHSYIRPKLTQLKWCYKAGIWQ